MRVLVIGGSGYVGGLVLPALAERHSLRVFDRKPPSLADVEYVEGDLTDFDGVRAAMEGIEAVLYMAMGSVKRWGDVEGSASSFDVNVKGVYLALRAAHEAGIAHAVYTSSMSVYADLTNRHFPDEDVPLDATDFYGFTKRLGEEVCRAAVKEWGLSVNALRLCLPTADEKWQAVAGEGHPVIHTAAADLSRALLAALDRRFDGFEAFMISGDYTGKWMDMSKAKRLLDWEPLARPRS